MSSSERKSKIPDAPAPVGVSGNLLSSVAPPSQLPNFITAVPAPAEVVGNRLTPFFHSPVDKFNCLFLSIESTQIILKI